MDFNSLLQQAQRLTSETQSQTELPVMDRSVSQVLEAMQEFHSRVTQTGSKDIQAHILLGSKGVDLPKITQKLEAISSRTTFDPLDPIGDTDVQSFLKNERENAILSVIEEVNSNSHARAQKLKWEHIKSEWRNEKSYVLNSLVAPSQDFIDLQKVPDQTLLNESSVPCSRLERVQLAFAQDLADYNDLVVNGSFRPNLVQRFADVASAFDDEEINDIWSVMTYMADTTEFTCYSDPIQSRQKVPQFIYQAKQYLESRYKLYMETVILSNLRAAERGGVPSVRSLIVAFVNLIFNQSNSYGMQDFTTDGKPLWPLIYYSLRCGELKIAIQFLQNCSNGYEDFIEMLTDKLNNPDGRINPNLEAQLKLQYCNKIKNSTDPFKKATYCVYLYCDPTEQHPEVARTTDDFLWMKLSIIRTDEHRDPNMDQLTYAGLQTLILEKYGERHFNASEQGLLYFQVLALTGQFEAAIEFLSRNKKMRTHAVHLAIALQELCMLGTPRNVQQPLLSVDPNDPTPLRRLNYARLIMLYVKSFEESDMKEAMQYYYCLRNLKDPEGRNLFMTCVCDLALSTRNFNKIFGTLDVSGSGIVVGGLFNKYSSPQFNLRKVAGMVGDEFVRKGLFEEAISAFDIAGMHNEALHYTSTLLVKVVHSTSASMAAMRERLAAVSAVFTDRLRAHQIAVDPQVRSTFKLLADLMVFFDHYHAEKYTLALEALARTKLAPMSMTDLRESIIVFKRLGNDICKIFPDVLVTAMDIISLQYHQVKRSASTLLNIDVDTQLDHLREKAKTLTNMAATVPYRMPSEINKRLVQAEIMMH